MLASIGQIGYKKLATRSLRLQNVDIIRRFCSTKKDAAGKSTPPPKSPSKTAQIATTEYKLHKLTVGPSASGEVTTEDARTWLSNMMLIRHMEIMCAKYYQMQIIRGFCHLYSGEEAVAAGIYPVLEKDDAVITSYRSHSWVALFGKSVHRILAELFGKETGIVRGKGGSIHMYTKNFYGGNGIVGAQVPLGTGVALKMKYLKEDAVMFAIYGDGAANQGQIFEAFNMAKLWNLPVIFVCENNQYAMGTSAGRSAASTDYYTRGDYIPGIFVDGMNVVTVHEATKFAKAYVKSGKGPIVLEMNTYRYYGHSMSDPGTSYRTREEVKEVRTKKDPINKFKNIITANNLLTVEEMTYMDLEAKKQVEEAAQQALKDKIPKVEELTYDVYMNDLDVNIRGVDPWNSKKHKNVRTLA